MESFYQYSKDLAINMHMKGVTSIQIRTHNYQMVRIRESKKEKVWSRFFDDRDRLTRLARLGAQIIEDDGVVRFLHKSIMEYFAARTIFDEILEFNPFDSDYDFCIDKGSLIDTDKAVFKFFNEIQSSQPTLSTYNDTLFDRKLFEIFNNPHKRKRFYGQQINIFDIHQLLPNLFLTILRRNTVIGMIRKTGTGSVAILNIIEILNWACSESGNSNNFIDALQFVLNEDQQFSSNLKSILEKCHQEMFFVKFYGKGVQNARKQFCKSLAAYSLVCYFLQIKDRHNGNIMLHKDGHIVHIDFGYFLSNSPGINLSYPIILYFSGKGLEFERKIPFKLLNEYIEVLGGHRSALFQEFRSLFYKGFLAARKHREQILILVKMMYSSQSQSFPSFKGGMKTIRDLEQRFCPPGVEESDLKEYCYHLINQSIDNWRAMWYDKYQYFFQGILY